MRPGIIITARMNSSRLPGKVLMPLGGRTVLDVIIENLRLSEMPIAIATCDDAISGHVCYQAKGVVSYMGGETDVRDRVIQCAEAFKLDPIVRITGDCPFVDYSLVRTLFADWQRFKRPQLIGLACGEFAMEQGGNCYPEGVDAEIVSLAALKDFGDEQDGDREHVTQHIKRRGNYRLLRPDEDWSDVKLSIDTMEDYRQACLIAGRVGFNAGWREIAECARWWKGQEL